MSALAQDSRSHLPPIILLVERDRDSVEHYSRCFEDAGLWVAVTREPDEALAAAEDLKPDLIVTDSDTAEPEEVEVVVDAFKRHPSLGRVPVIKMASAPLGPSHADSVLIKPVTPSLLLHRTRELLARAGQASRDAHAMIGRGQALLDHSTTLLQQSSERLAPERPEQRRCPGCGTPLEWVEHGTIGGTGYDYYRWCIKGCGLYCFDRSRVTWVRLA